MNLSGANEVNTIQCRAIPPPTTSDVATLTEAMRLQSPPPSTCGANPDRRSAPAASARRQALQHGPNGVGPITRLVSLS
jgi:hypothetical protein